MKSKEALKVRGWRSSGVAAAAQARRRRHGGAGAAAQARRRRRGICAFFAPSNFFSKKILGSAKEVPGRRRVYDLRHFRAGAKQAQNRRTVCSWVKNETKK